MIPFDPTVNLGFCSIGVRFLSSGSVLGFGLGLRFCSCLVFGTALTATNGLNGECFSLPFLKLSLEPKTLCLPTRATELGAPANRVDTRVPL